MLPGELSKVPYIMYVQTAIINVSIDSSTIFGSKNQYGYGHSGRTCATSPLVGYGVSTMGNRLHDSEKKTVFSVAMLSSTKKKMVLRRRSTKSIVNTVIRPTVSC